MNGIKRSISNCQVSDGFLYKSLNKNVLWIMQSVYNRCIIKIKYKYTYMVCFTLMTLVWREQSYRLVEIHCTILTINKRKTHFIRRRYRRCCSQKNTFSFLHIESLKNTVQWLTGNSSLNKTHLLVCVDWSYDKISTLLRLITNNYVISNSM